MSTHSFISRRQRRAYFAACFALGGLLIALQLMLSSYSTVFAAARRPLDPPQNVARAGVSTVRLLTSYVDAKGAPVAQCTGLGILVASWTFSGDQGANQVFNNWVLTDGSLVNPGPQALCVSSHPESKLSSVEVFFNSLYNPQPISFTINAPKIDVRCQDTTCNNGPALFSFPTDVMHTQPHVDVATTDQAQVTAIALTKSASSTEIPLSSNTSTSTATIADYTQKTVPQYLTLNQLQQVNGESSQEELGTPIVNNAGELTSMHLNSTGSFTAVDISDFISSKLPELNSPTPHLNLLHDSWNQGIRTYYQKDFTTASAAFQAAAGANPQFEAANTFAQLSSAAATRNRENNGAPGTTGTSQPSGVAVGNILIPFWLLILFGLILLIALLLLVSLTFGRARVRRKLALKAEYEEAERHATIEAQRIAEMEAPQGQARRDPALQPTLVQVELPPTAPQARSRTNGDLRCPRCGGAVQKAANYCPTCRLILSPSESGLHLRIPNSAPVVASGSIADQPTIDIVAGRSKNGKTDTEKTVPYAIQHLKNNRLGLAVVTHTDPGIKRKYKPNEDSLFAAQGTRTNSPAPQDFGLFVVADGMGGHANGQNASRLAIQTIIDYVLPRLLKDSDLQEGGFAQLLVEGVKHANQAVHQHNIEQHGDMGTTVTAALVVDTTAYVANVGDSRTYLYRESDGLAKVTQDHSVVASLVEAGIIKPDDIYTHPKRNQIYRSLGEKPAVEVDAFTVRLQVSDKLLLCSDGLWDMVRDPKIEEVIKQAEPKPDTMGDALVQAALDGGGEDNVSVIVVQVTASPQGGLKPGVRLLTKPDTVQMPQL